MPRALLSVSDKTGIDTFARALQAAGFELLSTGGTYRAIAAAGVPVTSVDDVTHFPEILGGRVKTLHPHIHGGVLAKRDQVQLAELASHEIEPIDLVVVNLYPFEATSQAGAPEEECLEQIDIGGPTLLRAAAKNYPAVVVVCDPSDYQRVGELLTEGVSLDQKRQLARKAFVHTAAYDAAITRWFDEAEALPTSLHLTLERTEILRYGENPHQQGARYRQRGQRGWWDGVKQRSGVALSYLNVFDADAAWRLVFELGDTPAAVIIKHANPCGAAVADTIEAAYARAFEGDPKSAFGGIVALNRPVTENLAEVLLANPKADVLIAPGYEENALERLLSKRKKTRILEAPPPAPIAPELRRIDGGFLYQHPDPVDRDPSAWQVVTERKPSDNAWQDAILAWMLCAYTKSNAIVLVAKGQAVGIGAGQQSRVDAAEIAVNKAAGRAQGGACASDAFFPFRDGLEVAAKAGIDTVIQPGGSIRDQELTDAANELGLAMVMTGTRHFRH